MSIGERMPMERRTFVRGAFGFVALAVCAGAGAIASRNLSSEVARVAPDDAVGPLLVEGIRLVDEPDGGRVAGMYEDTQLFVVDRTGAELVALADGTRTIDEAADVAGVSAADAASFFVTLGRAGYLQNEVYVNLCEVSA